LGNEDRCSEENGVLPLFVYDLKAGVRSERQRNDRIEKTCQPGAMKHLKQNKRAPQTHPSALAVPSYHRILVKHGLIEKTVVRENDIGREELKNQRHPYLRESLGRQGL
jgi:hypothetical protein